MGQKAKANKTPSSKAPALPRLASFSPFSLKPQEGSGSLSPQQHERSYRQQHGAKKHFSVPGNSLLNAKQAGPFFQHSYQYEPSTV